MPRVTVETVDHVARLAHLSLTAGGARDLRPPARPGPRLRGVDPGPRHRRRRADEPRRRHRDLPRRRPARRPAPRDRPGTPPPTPPTASSACRASSADERRPRTAPPRSRGAVAGRETSAEEVTREHLDAHRARDPALDAFLAVTAERALAQARRLDAALAGGAAPGPAGRRARRGQGRPRHRGRAHDLRLAHPRGLPPALHRHRGGAARGGGRGRDRQDEHGRVRDGLVHREQRLQGHAQSLGPRARARRLVRRLRGGGRRGHGAAGPRHRHRRLDPPARRALRRRRPQADLRPREPLRPGGLRLVAGPGRARWPAPSRTSPSPPPCSPASTPRDATSAAIEVPRLPRGPRPRARRACASACPGRSSRRAWMPGVMAAFRQALARPRGGGRADGRGRAPPRAARHRHVLHRRHRGGLEQPRALRRRALRPARARARDLRQHVRRDPRPRLRPRGQAPHHPRHLRALVRLLRRLLPARAEGPHAHPPRLRAGLPGLRRGGHADDAHARLPPRREDGRPAADVPGGHLHGAREPGRHSRACPCPAGSSPACPWACSSWAGRSTRRRCSAPGTPTSRAHRITSRRPRKARRGRCGRPARRSSTRRSTK